MSADDAALLADLYRVADDGEADVLDALRRRAGHIWLCGGPPEGDPGSCWDNDGERSTCERCGRPRAETEVPA